MTAAGRLLLPAVTVVTVVTAVPAAAAPWMDSEARPRSAHWQSESVHPSLPIQTWRATLANR